MSTSTTDLQLFKYDTSTDGKEVFSISTALNANWDKIDSFATAIKSLSNLSAQGEKRFTDLENSIANKLEADVLLEENGYIKFNNCLKLIWMHVTHTTSAYTIIFTTAFQSSYVVTFSGEEASLSAHSAECSPRIYNKSLTGVSVYVDISARIGTDIIILGY